MTRRLSLALGGAVVTAATLGLGLLDAGAAHAVTNPAQHPAPVTVTIDGQTYHDGLDTLPGYDDDACTAIPNVQYDFDANEIYYYDDDGTQLASAHWTEWSRISSYQTWEKQHQQSSAPPKPPSSHPAGHVHSSSPSHATHSHGATTAASHDGAAAATSASASSPAVATTAGPSGTSSSAGASSSAAASSSGVVAVAAPAAGATSSVGAASGTSDGSGTVSQPAASLAAQSLGEDVPKGIGQGTGNTRLAGLALLLGLGAVSIAVLLGNLLRRQTTGRRRMKGAHS